MLGQPPGRRLVGDVAALEQQRIQLGRRLQGVAPVDEQGSTVPQNDRQPGGAGEAGQPGEALGGRRQVLAPMLIGQRQDQAVEALLGQDRAQTGEAHRDRRLGRFCGRDLGLEPAQMLAQLQGVRGCDQIEPGIGLEAHRRRGHALEQGQHVLHRALDAARLEQPRERGGRGRAHRHRQSRRRSKCGGQP